MAKMYVSHPVSKDLKADIRKQGYTVVDIRFKPDTLQDGDKVHGEKPKRKQRKDPE